MKIDIEFIPGNYDIHYRKTYSKKEIKNIITITLPSPPNISGKNRVFIFAEDKISNLSFIFDRDFVF